MSNEMENRPDPPFEVPGNIDPDAFLLLGDPCKETEGRLNRLWLPVGGTFVFTFGSLMGNLMLKRPFLAGGYRHIFWAALGFVIGERGYHYNQRVYAERDLQYFHYISLHPEDFVAPKRVLYKDYLTSWHPCR